MNTNENPRALHIVLESMILVLVGDAFGRLGGDLGDMFEEVFGTWFGGFSVVFVRMFGRYSGHLGHFAN